MTTLTCDVAVIGAGTAGLAAERSARRAGAKTLLIDDGFVGTTCASVGCMPSKLLIAAAHAAHAIRGAAVFGIGAQEPVIDGPAVLRRVRRERDAFVAGTIKSISAIPDEIKVRARAHFVDQTSLALDDGRIVSAKAIVIATGSRPMVPDMFRGLGPLALTHETIFELADLPASIAVIGAGPIGLELAQALVRLGVDVEVFDQSERLAGLHDLEVAAELTSILEREMPIRLGVKISVERDGDAVSLAWSGTSAGTKRFERLLIATGRPPQLAGLGLEVSGLALDEHGTPLFDRNTMQCGATPIFVVGDACGQVPVLHEAASEGAIAGRNAASFPTVHHASRSVAFTIMFTDPPLAVLGRPSAEGDIIGSASYADQGRAKVEARNAGLVRLYADREDGRLVGAAMLGPAMDHMAHLLAWAMERGETASGLLDMPFYHPTFEEGLKPALHQICKAVDATGASAHDEGKLPGG
jgi:dihydrolipoamide dehydrogenase